MSVNNTGKEKQYRFRQLHGKTLRFQVKAAHDCHLAFTSGPEETSPMVEVFIGAWDGVSSAITFDTDDVRVTETPYILKEDEYREFWVVLDEDEVRVGKGGEWEPFMKETIPKPFLITHFGYSTALGASGSWWFLHNQIYKTENLLRYNFEPLYGRTFTFSVACRKDAHLAFTCGNKETTPMYEVFIGGWDNKFSAIRLNRSEDVAKVETPGVVSAKEMRKFWVSVTNGRIAVGSSDASSPFMQWVDPTPWKVTHVGYCTGWGATGKWKLEI